MKIEISDYESPHTLRALATLLTTLADAPTFEKGCAEPCDKPGPLPGRPCSYEPFDIFPNEVAVAPHSSPQTGMPSELTFTYLAPSPAASQWIIGNHEARTFSDAAAPLDAPVAPTPPPVNEAAEPDYSAASGYVPAPPVATDKTGAPWDARIHSSSKAMVADGTWRLKRGVDKSLAESVTRELQTAQSRASAAICSVHGEEDDSEAVLQVLDAALVPPSFTVDPAPHAAAPAAGAVTFSGVAGAVPSPPLGAAPLPPAPPLPFNEIMRFFAVHSMAGKLTHADMEAMAKHSGVELTQELINAANAAKRPAALAYLQDLVDSRS